jgi:CBS domain containing-hemolysin-like protein
MTQLTLAFLFTLGISAICSLLEALILSTTTAEIEALKQSHPRPGRLLERFKQQIEETSSAILTLNTIANTAGAAWVGALAEGLTMKLLYVSALLTVSILVFSEVVPKNLGVAYRRQLQPWAIYILWLVRLLMKPASLVLRRLLATFVKLEAPTEREQEEEIRLLADKSAEAGALSDSERELIKNALSLDDVRIEDIMTPRTVTMFLQADATVEEVFSRSKNIPFARIPVYEEGIDDIIGLVRRRDILQAYSEDRDKLAMRELMGDIVYVPETASAHDALQLFLRKHQQFAVVVDEYGSTAGVLTMEDVFEHLIGDEIYEESDLAVDMRELAKKRAQRRPAVTPVTEAGTVPLGLESSSAEASEAPARAEPTAPAEPSEDPAERRG